MHLVHFVLRILVAKGSFLFLACLFNNQYEKCRFVYAYVRTIFSWHLCYVSMLPLRKYFHFKGETMMERWISKYFVKPHNVPAKSIWKSVFDVDAEKLMKEKIKGESQTYVFSNGISFLIYTGKHDCCDVVMPTLEDDVRISCQLI